MDPTKYFFQSAVFATVFIITCVAARQAYADEPNADVSMVEDGHGGYVLEDLVVHRRAKISDVKIENDGSFSLLRDDSSTVFTALNSGSGAAVNFDVTFARNSVVMTADGQQTVAVVARALRLIGADVAFELIINQHPNQDPSGRKGLTKSRADAIVTDLRQRHSIKNTINVSYANTSLAQADIDGKNGKSQRLKLTVVNQGDELLATRL